MYTLNGSDSLDEAPSYDGGMHAGLGEWRAKGAVSYATSQHASGGDLTYAMTGLPAGLSINPSTGAISGTPTVPATSSVTWTVSNTGGSVNDTFNIVISGAASAPVNAVAPVVAGSTVVGSTLTCTDGTWTGSPMPTMTKQWQRFEGGSWSNIAGSNGNAYVTVFGDIGDGIRCVVTGTNASGSASANSNSITVTSVPANTVAPVVSGSAVVGSTLTCTDGTWTGSPMPTMTKQWQRFEGGSWSNIAGNNGNAYVTVPGDIGDGIRCVVTGTNASGSASANSNSITVTSVPANTVAPVVSGSAVVGSTLTCTDGTWTGSPMPTMTKQWQRFEGGSWSNTADNSGNAYVTVAGDIGDGVRCVVTGTNASGSASANSNSITVMSVPTNLVAPVVSGSAVVGSVLTSTDGTWTGSPKPTVTKQWQRLNGSWANIDGATGNTYTTVPGDIGTDVRCEVTGTNPAGSASGYSNAITVPAAASISATSHDLVIEANSATLDIGAHEVNRRVWATVLAGGTQNANFVASGGPTATQNQSYIGFPNRAVQLYELTGATGTSFAATWSGSNEHVATFRTTGLRPKSGGAIVVSRQAGANSTSSVCLVVVPIGGALLIHGKRYTGFTSSGPSISADESLSSTASVGVRGAWLNELGSEQTFNVTFTGAVSRTEKYGLCIVLEPES